MIVGPKDIHVVCSVSLESLKVFCSNGREVYRCKARFQGTAGPASVRNGDTPRGLWRLGYPDFIPEDDFDRVAFGPVWVPMTGQEGQEERLGRSGFGLHGGGSGLVAPGRILRQGWVPTHGCARVQNEDALVIAGVCRYVVVMGGVAWMTVGA